MKEPEDIKDINQRIRDFKTKHIDISKVSESQKNTYSQTAVGFQISVSNKCGAAFRRAYRRRNRLFVG